MQLGKLAVVFGLLVISLEASASFSSSSSGSPSASVNFLIDPSNPTIQIRTISDRSLEWFQEYINRIKTEGHDLNKLLKNGETLLHMAVRENAVNMVKALIGAGADPTKVNSERETVIEVALDMVQRDYDYQGICDIIQGAGYELVRTRMDEDEAESSEDEQEEASKSKKSPSGSPKNPILIDVDEDDEFEGAFACASRSPKISALGEDQLAFPAENIIDILNDHELADNTEHAKKKARIQEPLPVPPRYIPRIPLKLHISQKNYKVGEEASFI